MRDKRPATAPRLASVVLLGGSVRSSRFHTGIDRWALDLPCTQAEGGGVHSLLHAWTAAVGELCRAWEYAVPLRILADQSSETSPPAATNGHPGPVIDKDPIELRGTGGVLRDISGQYPADSYILVANAAQVLLRPLSQLAEALDGLQSDVAVLAHADGTPTTLMLVRCGALADLPALGFIDMKEQALPLLGARHPVGVVTSPEPVALGVRTAHSYIAALRSYHLGQKIDGAPEVWRSVFQIMEPGATVETGARLHDSVVLKGGRVEKGAIVVRSVVCPGGVVKRNQTLVDKLVLANGEQIPTEEAS